MHRRYSCRWVPFFWIVMKCAFGWTYCPLALLHRPPPPLPFRKPSHLLSSSQKGTRTAAGTSMDTGISTPMGILSEQNSDNSFIKNGTVTVLDRGRHHLVVAKPPTVVVHHSGWVGSRSSSKQIKNKSKEEPEIEIPMLQRVREAVGQRINLVHRLDRGASGCLLCTFQDDGNSTAILQKSMTVATKTYIALVRGEGILNGEDLKKRGWFCVDRPIKDEKGIENNATTFFRFVAGQDNDRGNLDRPRASLVLARPVTGRWHQVRKHWNGLSQPILGDSTHGISKVNREWKEKWGLPEQRTCLHLARMQLPPSDVCPEGIDVQCALADDMLSMLQEHLPDVLRDAEPILEQEGISLDGAKCSGSVLPYQIKLRQ